jgi:ubiquinone biosynthesis protein UbiJ
MPSQQAPQERNLFQSFLLILIETLLTFLLKHDRMSRHHAQHLIQRRALICVKTHLPSDTFYVTFAPQGVLFDFEVAENAKIDATVTASTLTLLRAFFTARPLAFEKISIKGESQLSNDLHHLMEYFNLPQIVSDWRHWFSFETNDVTPVSQRMKPLLRRIDEQRLQMSNMSIAAKQQAYELKIMKKRYQAIMLMLAVIIFLLVSGLLYTWWYFS